MLASGRWLGTMPDYVNVRVAMVIMGDAVPHVKRFVNLYLNTKNSN